MASATNPPRADGHEDAARAAKRPLPDAASGPDEPTLDGVFAADGVDLTVIRWMLERTPEQRLEAAQQLIDAAWALRRDQA